MLKSINSTFTSKSPPARAPLVANHGLPIFGGDLQKCTNTSAPRATSDASPKRICIFQKVTSAFKGFRSHRVSFHSLPAKHFLWKNELCMSQIFVAVIAAFYLSFLSRPTSMCDAPPTIHIMPGIHRLAYKSLLQICRSQPRLHPILADQFSLASQKYLLSSGPFSTSSAIRRCSKQPYWQVPWPKVAVSWCSWRRVFLLRVW